MEQFDITKIKFGAVPSEDDSRDYDLVKARVIKSKKQVASVSYPTDYMITNLPNIYDQGIYSTCVAHTLAELKESQELVEQNRRIRFSPGFIYANRTSSMEGMQMREALKNLQKSGVCEYDDFPYTGVYGVLKNKLNKAPELFNKAVNWKCGTYYRIRTLDELKYTLLNVGPVAITVPAYSGWNSKTGEIKNSGNNLGYHEMLVVGWKDNDTLIVQNSWGKYWGDNGIGYIKFNDYPISEMWSVADDSQLVDRQSLITRILTFIKELFGKLFKKQ